ncbi:hypothetical protein HY485_05065 [Candidatus Woesearchaeota archaeon]|nr:hypothetical protein [Candidatus Woesearchaeota archaeon]
MNKLHSKKAIIFSISLVLITLGTLVTLIIIINNLEKQISPTKNIGERAIDILNLRTKEEQTTFFIKQAAKISADKATKEFIENAGLLQQDCGKADNVVLWNTADKNCFETNFYENYEQYFNQQLNKYLAILAKTTKQEIPLDNYALFVNDAKTLSGLAVQPVQTDLINNEEKIGLHAFKPAFTIPFNHDFTFFPKLKTFVHNIIECGASKDQQNKEECIQGITSRTDAKLNMRKINDNIFAFETSEGMAFALTIVLR